MGCKENGIYPPTWTLYVNVIAGHGRGSHYPVYAEDIGKVVFTSPTEAGKKAAQYTGEGQ
jgi:hypothetical protein